MSDEIDFEPDPDDMVELGKNHNPSRPHRTLTLVSLSMVALGSLAVPTTSTLDQGIIFGRVAAAEDRDIEAMTLNQALGADLSSLVAEPPDELNAALIEVLEDVVATDFPARAQRQAELIARRLPDLVGLQEV